MNIECDFYQTPIPKGSNRKPRLHARVVTRGTATTDELAQAICIRSILTPGDVKAVLTSLADEKMKKRIAHLPVQRVRNKNKSKSRD